MVWQLEALTEPSVVGKVAKVGVWSLYTPNAQRR